MALDVLNFSVKGKLRVHKVFCGTMSEATFFIVISRDKEIKELSITIPKKYMYKKSSFNPTMFKKGKLKEYEVLIDFLSFSKTLVREKWGFTGKEYKELLLGITIYFLRYSSFGSFHVYMDLMKEYIKRVIVRLLP